MRLASEIKPSKMFLTDVCGWEELEGELNFSLGSLKTHPFYEDRITSACKS